MEPNFLVELLAPTSNCPTESDWGLFHSNTDGVMDLLTNPDNQNLNKAEVVVAVIDSGIDIDHKLLRNRVWVNEAERTGLPGVDDDGNGMYRFTKSQQAVVI